MTVGVPLAAFADVTAGIWGVLLGEAPATLALGPLDGDHALTPTRTTVEGSDDGTEWRIRWDGGDLTLAAAGGGGASTDRASTWLTPCAVRGHVTDATGTREVNSHAVRTVAMPAEAFESLRLIAAWFGEEHGVVIRALRPQGAPGQDRDQLDVVLQGEPETLSVFDPRLSTTYADDSELRRLGIELWIGETEEADLRPRRFAGKPAHVAALIQANGLTVNARALTCTGSDGTGAGVYVVALRA